MVFNCSKVPAYLNVVDIAGLVKGAAEGQGLGNAFLSNIAACDGIFNLCRKYYYSFLRIREKKCPLAWHKFSKNTNCIFSRRLLLQCHHKFNEQTNQFTFSVLRNRCF